VATENLVIPQQLSDCCDFVLQHVPVKMYVLIPGETSKKMTYQLAFVEKLRIFLRRIPCMKTTRKVPKQYFRKINNFCLPYLAKRMIGEIKAFSKNHKLFNIKAKF